MIRFWIPMHDESPMTSVLWEDVEREQDADLR